MRERHSVVDNGDYEANQEALEAKRRKNEEEEEDLEEESEEDDEMESEDDSSEEENINRKKKKFKHASVKNYENRNNNFFENL